MDENLHDIDKLFRDGIEGHQDQPPARIWDSIDHQLDKRNIISAGKRYRRLKMIAAALFFLLLGTIAYELGSSVRSGAKPTAGQQEAVVNEADQKKDVKESESANPEADSGKLNVIVVQDRHQPVSVNSSPGKDAGQGIEENGSNLNTVSQIPNESLDLKKRSAGKADRKTGQVPSQKTVDYSSTHERVGLRITDLGKIAKVRGNVSASRPLKAVKQADENIAYGRQVGQGEHSLVFGGLFAEQVPVETKNREFFRSATNSPRITPEVSLKNAAARLKKGSIQQYRYKLFAYYAPQVGFNRLVNDHDHDRGGGRTTPDRDDIKRHEGSPAARSVGIVVELPLKSNWNIQSGITYAQTKIEINPKKVFAQLDNTGSVKYRFDCSTGYTYLAPESGTTTVPGDSINVTESNYKLEYVGVPLRLSYRIKMGRFDISPIAGVSANFSVGRKIQTSLQYAAANQKQTTSTIYGMRPVYFSAMGGIGVDYRVSQRVALSVMPNASFALSSTTRNAAVKSYPSSLGLAAGFKVSF